MQQGYAVTYSAVSGPHYETQAEGKVLRAWVPTGGHVGGRGGGSLPSLGWAACAGPGDEPGRSGVLCECGGGQEKLGQQQLHQKCGAWEGGIPS